MNVILDLCQTLVSLISSSSRAQFWWFLSKTCLTRVAPISHGRWSPPGPGLCSLFLPAAVSNIRSTSRGSGSFCVAQTGIILSQAVMWVMLRVSRDLTSP